MIYKSCQTLVATKHYLESLSFVSRVSWWKFSNLLLLFELQSVYLWNVAVFSSSSNISSQKLSDNADWEVWQVSDKCSKLSSQSVSLSVQRSLLETSKGPDISQVRSFPVAKSAKTVSKRSRFWRLQENESPAGGWCWLSSLSTREISSTLESLVVGKLKPISGGAVRWGFSSSCLILLKL